MTKSIKDILDSYKSVPDFFGIDVRDVNSRSHYNDQVLHMACISGNVPDVLAILDAGADIDAIGEGGMTPLHYAVLHDQLDIVKLLLDKGADFKIHDNDGCTALQLAIDLEKTDIKKIFESTQ